MWWDVMTLFVAMVISNKVTNRKKSKQPKLSAIQRDAGFGLVMMMKKMRWDDSK